jgi:hypothetical protein
MALGAFGFSASSLVRNHEESFGAELHSSLACSARILTVVGGWLFVSLCVIPSMKWLSAVEESCLIQCQAVCSMRASSSYLQHSKAAPAADGVISALVGEPSEAKQPMVLRQIGVPGRVKEAYFNPCPSRLVLPQRPSRAQQSTLGPAILGPLQLQITANPRDTSSATTINRRDSLPTCCCRQMQAQS